MSAGREDPMGSIVLGEATCLTSSRPWSPPFPKERLPFLTKILKNPGQGGVLLSLTAQPGTSLG